MIPNERIRERFIQWWEGELRHGPLMRLVARKSAAPEEPVRFESAEEYFLCAPKRDRLMRQEMAARTYLGDAFPQIDTNLIAGSLAVYLGCRPVFTGPGETVWHQPCLTGERLEDEPLPVLVRDNSWWISHKRFLRELVDLSAGDYAVGMPGLQENLDTLSELRGVSSLMLDLIDSPQAVERFLERIDEAFFACTDELMALLADTEGGNFYNGFFLWGPGRTLKLQCDVSALVDEATFRRYVAPMLRRQCERYPFALYHLDGPGALHQLGALLEIEGVRAVQWIPGAGNGGPGEEKWRTVLDQIREAGKSLWVGFDELDPPAVWAAQADTLIARYGPQALYLVFPEMGERQARELLDHARTRWGTEE